MIAGAALVFVLVRLFRLAFWQARTAAGQGARA